MKVFVVGGFVRDTLLGLTPKDKDFVIVGATEQDVQKMLDDGFQQVGADFPVFLHPETGDEYALARVERKTGVGYGGFTTETNGVSLEDDLRRRDLTINAMAMDPETGEIFDFFGGQHDLKNGVLRHVSEAFQEDPLRVLRVARFAARYGFDIAPETMELMFKIVKSGEMRELAAERVWVEFEKLMYEKDAARGLAALQWCNFLPSHMGVTPEIMAQLLGMMFRTAGVDGFNKLDGLNRLVAFFVHFHDFEDRFRMPTDVVRAVNLFNKVALTWMYFNTQTKERKVEFFNDIGLLNKQTSVFNSIQGALNWLAFSCQMNNSQLVNDMAKVMTVDCTAIAAGKKNGEQIKKDIFAARVAALD